MCFGSHSERKVNESDYFFLPSAPISQTVPFASQLGGKERYQEAKVFRLLCLVDE